MAAFGGSGGNAGYRACLADRLLLKAGRAAGRLMRALIHGLTEGLPVDSVNGRQGRNYLQTVELARAPVGVRSLVLIGPFNIASSQAVEFRQLVMTLAELAGFPELVRFAPRPRPEKDFPKLIADTGKQANTSFLPPYNLKRVLQCYLRERRLVLA